MVLATYEGTYATRIEAENAAFRLKLMGHKTKIKVKKGEKAGLGFIRVRYEVFSDA